MSKNPKSHKVLSDQMITARADEPLTGSKSDIAYLLLEERIITMDIPPGAMLSEVELAQQLDIGRTPVREALQRLAHENLVEIMPRRGIRVTEIDIKKQLRLLEVRREVENLQASMAAKRANAIEKDRFAIISQKMLESADNDDYMSFVRLDQEYDTLMAAAADNEFIASMLKQVHGLSRRFYHRHYLVAGDLDNAVQLHASVATAISKGDPSAAKTASNELMDYILTFTLATLDL